MGSLCPYEIVASVVRWSHDQVMCGQCFERLFENRTWQVWAVAVEGNSASLMIFREVRKHRSEASSKTFTILRNAVRFVACQVCMFLYVRTLPHDRAFELQRRP